MKKITPILLAAAMIFSLCSAVYAEEETAEPDYTTGTPWPDIDLEGVVVPDTPAQLKDNFALYVNKDKILNLKIPEGYSYAGSWMDLKVLAAQNLRDMFLS